MAESSITNATRSMSKFDGKRKELFREWTEKVQVCISMYNDRIHKVLQGQPQQAEDASAAIRQLEFRTHHLQGASGRFQRATVQRVVSSNHAVGKSASSTVQG